MREDLAQTTLVKDPEDFTSINFGKFDTLKLFTLETYRLHDITRTSF